MSQRVDVALAARGLARSRRQAADYVQAGLVQVNGSIVTKSALHVTAEDDLVVLRPDPWVSRAAHKLLGALDDSRLSVTGRVLDAGASTGGFTQVLLSRGAQRVYAVDVGHDQLAAEVRTDPRVVVHEGLNLRDLTVSDLEGQPVDLVVADVSFISLRLLLDPLLGVIDPLGSALLLVKPQFEVGRDALDARGVVRDDEKRRQAVDHVLHDAAERGWRAAWQGPSRLPGPAGNREHFVLLRREAPRSDPPVRVLS